jgi:hypothetical protein
MNPATRPEHATKADRICTLTVHIAGTPLARPGCAIIEVRVAQGTPLVWVIGMLAEDRSAYDRFTRLVDRGTLRLRLDGRQASWWQEVEGDGVLALLHRPEGVEVGREAGRIPRLDPERPLSLEASHQAFAAK